MLSFTKKWGSLPSQTIRSSYMFKSPSICKTIEIVFNLQKKLRSSSIYKKMWGCLPFTIKCEVVFHLPKNVRSSSIFNNVRSSSISKTMWGCLSFSKKCEVVFHLQKKLGRLSFTNRLEVVFHLPKNIWSSSIHMLDGQFIWIRQFGYFSSPRPAASGRMAGTLIIELTQLNFNCQLERAWQKKRAFRGIQEAVMDS
jgi:hypothetical protein